MLIELKKKYVCVELDADFEERINNETLVLSFHYQWFNSFLYLVLVSLPQISNQLDISLSLILKFMDDLTL